jgi:hypothetical protein
MYVYTLSCGCVYEDDSPCDFGEMVRCEVDWSFKAVVAEW